LLNKAVAAVKSDKAKALDMFNTGKEGFKDRDLYVFCSNASDGIINADPTHKGTLLQDFKDAKGFAAGEEMFRTAKDDTISEITYLWSRPGSDTPIPKTMFFTKTDDQICGVGYYK
jgi:hypothetical protein